MEEYCSEYCRVRLASIARSQFEVRNSSQGGSIRDNIPHSPAKYFDNELGGVRI